MDTTTPWLAMIAGLGTLALGVAVLIIPDMAFTALARILAVLLAFRGVVGVYSALRHRTDSPEWTFNLVKGGVSVAAAVVIFVLPDSIETALLLSIAFLAITTDRTSGPRSVFPFLRIPAVSR